MRKKTFYLAIIFSVTAGLNNPVRSCTNFLITPGASAHGSSMISYAADSHVLYGELYYTPAQDHPPGSMLKIYEWDTGKYLGEIAQVPHTYSVVGNMNEHQVSIGETTYGGRRELIDTTGIMDYGSLIYVTLQRARTAREAIEIMADLVDTYGYYSSGESFSIADKNEVWIMELIGKGPGNKGAVWVALRIPDGYVSAHANQARIQTFPLDDPENCLYAPDVIDFAIEQGYYEGKKKDFSFSDTYAPVDFGGARFCELRVWSFFNKVTDGMDAYWDYATGHDLDGERMPLWVKPKEKISRDDAMEYMRDHLEGTPLDMTKDVGAGPFGLPYRWRPLTWEVDGVTYCNERVTATQQSGFTFIAESRPQYPDWIGGIFWFGLDDAATSCYMPMYCGITRVPESVREGNGDMINYSPTSAFWLFNRVANFCYLRYDTMSADVIQVQQELEEKFQEMIPAIDQAALALYEDKPAEAREFITNFSVSIGDYTFDRWKELSEFLLVKYIDGNIKKEKDGEFLYNGMGGKVPAFPAQPGYPEWYYRLIIDDTGDKLKVPGEGH